MARTATARFYPTLSLCPWYGIGACLVRAHTHAHVHVPCILTLGKSRLVMVHTVSGGDSASTSEHSALSCASGRPTTLSMPCGWPDAAAAAMLWLRTCHDSTDRINESTCMLLQSNQHSSIVRHARWSHRYADANECTKTVASLAASSPKSWSCKRTQQLEGTPQLYYVMALLELQPMQCHAHSCQELRAWSLGMHTRGSHVHVCMCAHNWGLQRVA